MFCALRCGAYVTVMLSMWSECRWFACSRPSVQCECRFMSFPVVSRASGARRRPPPAESENVYCTLYGGHRLTHPSSRTDLHRFGRLPEWDNQPARQSPSASVRCVIVSSSVCWCDVNGCCCCCCVYRSPPASWYYSVILFTDLYHQLPLLCIVTAYITRGTV